ncbi:hypothetical protein ABL78_5289 [Leptomonas seymouri]|uniref:Transmembrane protein n=1 Tax=Leptomonas seymouri TaxID=5684 RepID=A0A0N1IJG0_LEPSE|nr:hypothetical protein ABL78_5289 [Leptomonas seymouri]|eukprot:KPI85668.1 hypothetical protein ABL78_5289 [Leptomonas seymouri]
MIQRPVWLATAFVFAILLLASSTWTCAATASPKKELLQRQRLQALTKYVERVGAALDLLANGPIGVLDDEEDAFSHEGSTRGSKQSSSAHYFTAPTVSGHVFPPVLAQLLQYPHTAVQTGLQAVIGKASAVRTLVSVLTNSKLSEEEETQLAQVHAAAAHTNVFGDAGAARPETGAAASASSVSPAALHRARSAFLKSEVLAHAEDVGRSRERRLARADTDDLSSRSISCLDGYVALPSDTPMRCAATGATTIGEYLSVPPEDRNTCFIVPKAFDHQQQQCICPVDAFIIEESPSFFVCMARPVSVQVLLDDAYLCHSAADAAVGLPSMMESEYCIKTTRHATLNLTVRWKYSYLSMDALRAALSISGTIVTPSETPIRSPSLQWVVMGETPPHGIITNENGSPYAKGNYSELTKSNDLFNFMAPIAAETEEEAQATATEGFYVSANSPIEEGYVFSAVFCFATPRKMMDHLVEESLHSPGQMAAYFGNTNGISTHTLQLQLSNVSDDFVEGNQMYVETGIRGGSAVYSSSVARLHISFTDLETPPDKTFHYKKQFNPLYTLLIVAISVIVVGAGLAVLWYHLMKKEEYEDNLVSDAQRTMKNKKAM